MLKVDSIGDGYPCNWPCTCDACHAAACTLYCHTDSAYLCICCDQCIHAAIPPALPDHCVWICTECEKAPADFTCKADAASLCINCDFEIHSANPIACCHNRVPVSPLTGLVYAASSNTYHCELPAPMFDVGNEILADEAEADYFLLLDLDSTENQPNSEFMYSKAVDEYLEPVEYDSGTKFQYQDEYQQQQPYGTNQGKNISDIILPVQSVDARKIQHNISFTGEFEASKAAFINTPSSIHSVPLSFMNAGISAKEITSEFSSSYTRFQSGTTELFHNTSLVMPLQSTPMNREAKVLKYREKKKARKFEKKIRYASRKANAETRPRVKGRFARRTDIELEEDQLFSIEEYGYAIVPSC